jgi:hypothetical protein
MSEWVLMQNGGQVPAVALAGVWRAARKDLWKFDVTNYGPRWKEFATEGFDHLVVTVSADDGRFTFKYGSLVSGVGQWFEGDEPDSYVGRSKITHNFGRPANGVETEQRITLLDGDDLLEIAYTIASGSCKGLEVVEYMTRMEETPDLRPDSPKATGL